MSKRRWLAVHNRMGHTIRPQNVTIISKDGEVTVNLVLELNINLSTEGIKTSVISKAQDVPEEPESENTSIPWEIPSFKHDTKVKFGKSVTEEK